MNKKRTMTLLIKSFYTKEDGTRWICKAKCSFEERPLQSVVKSLLNSKSIKGVIGSVEITYK